MAWKNSAGEGIRTPASQRPTGWLVFGIALFVPMWISRPAR